MLTDADAGTAEHRHGDALCPLLELLTSHPSAPLLLYRRHLNYSLDSGLNDDLPKGTRVEIPLWLARHLARQKMLCSQARRKQ